MSVIGDLYPSSSSQCGICGKALRYGEFHYCSPQTYTYQPYSDPLTLARIEGALESLRTLVERAREGVYRIEWLDADTIRLVRIREE